PADQQIDYAKRIEYSVLQTSQHLQELDLKKNKYDYLPNLVLYGGLSTHAYRFNFDFFDGDKAWYPTAVVGATLNIPIFDGFQKNSRIAQSKLNLKKIENGFKSLEQGITFETQTAKVSLQNSISSLQTQKKNRELAEEVSRVSKIKYDQGVGSNLEVVTAETSLKEAEINYYSALFDVLVAKVDYQKATGSLIKN
ncbi:MAG: TolC family protein, partial [Bacteroidota bacterium]